MPADIVQSQILFLLYLFFHIMEKSAQHTIVMAYTQPVVPLYHLEMKLEWFRSTIPSVTPYFQLVALPCPLNMLSMSTSLLVHKVVFMADRIMIIPILGKLPFVGTPFITEDGCAGSNMASNMTYKCLPSAIPDKSQNGSSGLPVDLQHPKDPLPFTAPSVATSTTMVL